MILTAAGGAADMPDTAALYAGEPEKHSDQRLFHAFLEQEIARLSRLARKLSGAARAADACRRIEYLEAIAGMERMREGKYDKAQ